jgi:hypothetical protein
MEGSTRWSVAAAALAALSLSTGMALGAFSQNPTKNALYDKKTKKWIVRSPLAAGRSRSPKQHGRWSETAG